MLTHKRSPWAAGPRTLQTTTPTNFRRGPFAPTDQPTAARLSSPFCRWHSREAKSKWYAYRRVSDARVGQSSPDDNEHQCVLVLREDDYLRVISSSLPEPRTRNIPGATVGFSPPEPGTRNSPVPREDGRVYAAVN